MNLFYLTQDINFQKALLLVAIIALILAILVSAYKLNSVVAIAGQSWPPVVAPCPDYWDLSGSYCINSSWHNVGSFHYNPATNKNIYNSTSPSCADPSFCVIPTSLFGDKKKWAKKNRFVWDGLTSD